MSIIVFAGPSMHGDDAHRYLDADVRPPASQGDVYCAALERPWAIAIIDGYFERVPSVWHKEILWAMSRGVPVFGAASMGALRAAELHAFGMVGVGSIFERFASGELLDDDEVAVAHAEADHGYAPASVALVDIRATLAAAQQRGVIDDATHTALLELAKKRHYAERGYPQLCHDARHAQLDVEQLARFGSFWRAHAVSAKHDDAVRLLRQLGQWRTRPKPLAVTFRFENTSAFQQLTRRFTARSNGTSASELRAEVIDELRLRPNQYQSALSEALTRRLALDFADSRGLELDPNAERAAIEAFRRERALWSGEDTTSFMSAQELDRDALRALAKRDALLRVVRDLLTPGLEAQLIDVLQSRGEYAQLAQRARAKRALLAQQGESVPSAEDDERASSEELTWYFDSFMQIPPPDDLERFWRELGYPDAFRFRRAVRRELACMVHAGGSTHVTESTSLEVNGHGGQRRTVNIRRDDHHS